MYFEQLLGTARTQKQVEILFLVVSTFFVYSRCFSVIFYPKTKGILTIKSAFATSKSEMVATRLPLVNAY